MTSTNTLEPSALPPGVALTTLDSGVRIVTETMPDVRSASVGFWVDAGSRDESGPVAGATHFLEHLLFKGTERRSALEIAEVLDAVGGDMNAFTTKELTCFYARCLDRDVPTAIDVLADMITSATIRAEDVDSEREVVLEEIRMHLDTPDDLVHSVWSEAWFGGHALGREVLGDEETITAMSRDHVAGWYEQRYVPRNLVVAVAGNVEHDEVVRLVEEAFAGRTRSGDVGPSRSAPAGGHGQPLAIKERPTEQLHVVLGGAGLPRGDDRRFAAAVLNQALGGGMASRLFQEVREKRGLVYTVFSFQSQHADTGTFAIYAGTAPRRVPELLDVLDAEVAKAFEGGLTDDEVERAKGHLTGSVVLALEDTSSRMSRIGKSLLTGVPLLSLDETIGAFAAVTPDEVADVARSFLGGPFTLAAVGTVDDDARRALEARAA